MELGHYLYMNVSLQFCLPTLKGGSGRSGLSLPQALIVSFLRELPAKRNPHTCWKRTKRSCKWNSGFIYSCLVSVSMLVSGWGVSGEEQSTFDIQFHVFIQIAIFISDSQQSTIRFSRFIKFVSSVGGENSSPVKKVFKNSFYVSTRCLFWILN